MPGFDPDLAPSDDRGHLLTEQANPRSRDLDQLSTVDLVNLFVSEDRRPQQAVEAASSQLTEAVTAITARLQDGGRLFYLGAGTSGRLGVLDAAECPPTFCSDPRWCRVFSREDSALLQSKGPEDLRGPGAMTSCRADAADCLIGIAAGGTTPRPRVSRMHAASGPWRSRWPVFRGTKPPFPVTSIFACLQGLNC